MLKDKQYEMDIVVTFIRGEYMKPMKRQSEEAEESERDTVYSNPFILCSMNKTQDPKKSYCLIMWKRSLSIILSSIQLLI